MRNMWAKIKSFVTGRPQFLVTPEAPIEEAFISGGIQYWQYVDIFAQPCLRALEATTFYEEMKSRISSEYLDEYIAAMTDILSDPKGINVTKLVLMTNTLKERKEFIIDADIVFKLASVLYFDENENPNKYDFKYNHEKIKNWKANEDVASFFLRTPIKNFLPFTDMSENDLKEYLKVAEKLKKAHSQILSVKTYSERKN